MEAIKEDIKCIKNSLLRYLPWVPVVYLLGVLIRWIITLFIIYFKL